MKKSLHLEVTHICDTPNYTDGPCEACAREAWAKDKLIASLLPCPFCGSENLELDNLGDGDDWFVSCLDCEIQQIARYAMPEAVERWNKRAEAEGDKPAQPAPMDWKTRPVNYRQCGRIVGTNYCHLELRHEGACASRATIDGSSISIREKLLNKLSPNMISILADAYELGRADALAGASPEVPKRHPQEPK